MSNIVFQSLPGYLAKATPFPGRVGLEWWGLNANMMSIADRFAAAHHTTFVPDLYRGKCTSAADEAAHLMANLDWDAAVEDVRTAALALRELGCAKVAVLGFCMGGALTIAAACRLDTIDGGTLSSCLVAHWLMMTGVCFYGVPSSSVADPRQARCPLQLHFANLDDAVGFSDPKTADALEEGLCESGKPFEFFRYNAGHAFMNAARPEAYHQASAELAHSRALQFLHSL